MAEPLVSEVRERIERLELGWNRHGLDPYGISKEALFRHFVLLGALYRNYFRVTHGGLEHLPTHGRVMLVGNHSGGVALDAAMVACVAFFELDPPRLAQGMADHFLSRLPFAATFLSRCGHFNGLPAHAFRLLSDDRLLMVFPEGARGTAKLYPERHSLVEFGSGFVRLALRARAPIVPFAFLGGGDAIPTVWNSRALGKLLGVPYVPFTPYGLPLPLPARLHVQFSEPMRFEGTGQEEDELVFSMVDQVKARIRSLLDEGHALRGGVPALPPRQP
jgi:1-acyl-sn-glycerol-3-phosphate acyltransferase